MRKLIVPSNEAVTAADLVGQVRLHPWAWLLAGLAMLIGSAVMLPGVAALWRTVAGRGRALTQAGALLLGVGLVASVGHALAFYGMAGIGADTDVPAATFQSIDDESNRYPLFLLVIVLFVVGTVVGTVLLAVGLRRARLVPVWVPVAAIVFALTGTLGGVASGVVGVLAAVATFGPMAWVIARAPGPEIRDDAADVVALAS